MDTKWIINHLGYISQDIELATSQMETSAEKRDYTSARNKINEALALINKWYNAKRTS